MFSLWNPTDATQSIIATVYYGDGSGTYHLPINLGAQASTAIDIGMLIMSQTPGGNGEVIPRNVRDGSVSFSSVGADSSQPDGKERMAVVVAGANFNVSEATCGENCTVCNGYSNFRLNPSSDFCLIGCSVLFYAQATDSTGNTATLTPDSWISDNTAVMTVNGGGSAQAVGTGSTYINAIFNSIITWQGTMCVSENMTPNCNPQYEDAYAQVAVAPALNSISPAQGAKGATTPVTLNGSGFGSSCTSVTIAAGTGIAVNCTSVSSTQIQASLVVSASAAAGNHSVNVTFNGETSNSVNFFVQIPAKLVFFNTGCAPNGRGALQVIPNGNVVDCGGVTQVKPHNEM